MPDNFVQSCRFEVEKSYLSSVSTNECAVEHRRKKISKRKWRRQLLKLQPGQNLEACRSSAMYSFRAVRNAIPYFLSNVHANVWFVEMMSRKAWSERTRQERFFYVRPYKTVIHEDSGWPARNVRSKLPRPLLNLKAEVSSLKSSCKARYRCSPSTIAPSTSARNCLGTVWKSWNSCFRICSPALALRVTVSPPRVSSYQWTWKKVAILSLWSRFTLQSWSGTSAFWPSWAKFCTVIELSRLNYWIERTPSLASSISSLHAARLMIHRSAPREGTRRFGRTVSMLLLTWLKCSYVRIRRFSTIGCSATPLKAPLTDTSATGAPKSTRILEWAAL